MLAEKPNDSNPWKVVGYNCWRPRRGERQGNRERLVRQALQQHQRNFISSLEYLRSIKDNSNLSPLIRIRIEWIVDHQTYQIFVWSIIYV